MVDLTDAQRELEPVLLCGLCRSGAGGECHMPGCALYGNRAPDLPLAALPREDGQERVEGVVHHSVSDENERKCVCPNCKRSPGGHIYGYDLVLEGVPKWSASDEQQDWREWISHRLYALGREGAGKRVRLTFEVVDSSLASPVAPREDEGLREALRVAADDLYKAANQFAGLMPEGQNQHKFTRKAERAEAAAASPVASREAEQREWTIAIITSRDDEPPDALFPDVGTVSAMTERDAVKRWGDEHPFDREHCTIYARPKGIAWGEVWDS